MKVSTDWFVEARWGVMTHFLASPPGGSKQTPRTLSAEEWNAQVDSVDADALASTLAEAGAGYHLLTIGQTSGHFCSPNATYDRLTGVQPSKCSRRDLIADMAEALRPHGIRLMAYLPAGPPSRDKAACEALHGHPLGEGGVQADPREAVMQQNWEAVVREWALRWGDRVHGWWIDGCYKPEIYAGPQPPNWESFAAALRAGNDRRIVAFNPGIMWPLKSLTEHEDYTAGEVDGAFFAGYWGKGGYFQLERIYQGAQLHVLSFLGTMWNDGDRPRFPDEFVVGYTKFLNSRGGVMTWDVPIENDCRIKSAFLPQLRALGKAVSAGGQPPGSGR